MSIGRKNKQKGSNAERFYAQVFRDLGFSKCVTSRQGSRLYDNAKIDLMFIPFNVQIKAGKQKNMNAGKVLLEMDGMMKALFPEEDQVFKHPKILIYRPKSYSKGTENDVVFMSLKQFKKFRKLSRSLTYDTIKTARFEMRSEYKTMVSVKFSQFKEKIINKYGINNNTTK